MPEIVTQPGMRLDRNARDQFGRVWLMAVEKSTMQPCGNIDPAGWTDPLKTPQRYLRVPKNEFGQHDPTRLQVLDKQWIADQRQARVDWRLRLLEIAQQKSPGGFDPTKVEENEWFVMLAGPKPWPSAEALEEALVRKNPALLGLAPLGPAERALLEMQTLDDIEAELQATTEPVLVAVRPPSAPEGERLTYPQFVKHWAQAGKTMQEIGPLWQEYKRTWGS